MTDTLNPHEHRIRVRYAECDAMGYLHHANYLVYLEEARTAALREQGIAYRDLEREGVFFVVAAATCRFLRPVQYDDVVTVRTYIDRFTRTRIDHRYEVHRDDDLMCRATTTLACVGRDGRPIVMPDRIWSTHQIAKPRRADRGP